MSGGEADLAAHGHRIDIPEMCVRNATARCKAPITQAPGAPLSGRAGA
jgi:hypothetical protein